MKVLNKKISGLILVFILVGAIFIFFSSKTDAAFIQSGLVEKPAHRWASTTLQFENPNGSWGTAVELRGATGLAGPQGIPGTNGTAATITVHSTETLAAGSSSVVTNKGTVNAANFKFEIPRGDKGEPGMTGGQGIPGTNGTNGTAATVAVHSTVTLDAGNAAKVSNSGTSNAANFKFEIPKGANGTAATVAVHSTVTLDPGNAAKVSNMGTSNAANFKFEIPKGAPGQTGPQGPPGPQGPAGATGATGLAPEHRWLSTTFLSFKNPNGTWPTGNGVDLKGANGTAATVAVHSTVTLDPGNAAKVSNMGTSNAANFKFEIPKGAPGQTGPQGPPGPQGPAGATGATGLAPEHRWLSTTFLSFKNPNGTWPTGNGVDLKGANGTAATVAVHSTVTLDPGNAAKVSNMGTSNAANFKFEIPKGAPGQTGPQGPQGPQGPAGVGLTGGYSGYIPKWTSGSAVTYSTIYDSGSLVTISANDGISAYAFHYLSDRRLKENIKTVNSALDKIKQLRGVSFDWKNGNGSSFGFIAQEVEKVFPDLVTTGDDGYKSVQYGNLTAPLVEAIKEQQNQIEEQGRLIKKLEARLSALEK